MSAFLVDTNVLSEVVKRRPSTQVVDRLRELSPSQVFTSVVCLMEIRFGAARHKTGAKLWERLRREVLARVWLPFDAAAGLKAGEVLAQLEAAGTRIGLEDVMIGATALCRGLVVATRNTRHLDRIPGLVTVNWWE